MKKNLEFACPWYPLKQSHILPPDDGLNSAISYFFFLTELRPQYPFTCLSLSTPRDVTFHKLQRRLTIDNINAARLVRVCNTIAFFSNKYHLWPERCADKLPSSILGLCRKRLNHMRNGSAILSVEVGIDLVEEVERCRVALLNREDKG